MELIVMEIIHTTIGQGGRVIIPAAFRDKLGIAIGDDITLMCDEMGMRISAPEAALSMLQNIAMKRAIKPKNRSVVEEFIAERRAEAKHD
jgi:AbrB family looped-hinge helix DNA binding protein